jgi:hypothetical protein
MGTSVEPMVEVILAFGNNPQGISLDSKSPGSRLALKPSGEIGRLTQRDAAGVLIAVDPTVGAKGFWLVGIDDLLRRIDAELGRRSASVQSTRMKSRGIERRLAGTTQGVWEGAAKRSAGGSLAVICRGA